MKKLDLFALIVLFFASCVPVKDAMNGTSRSNNSRRHHTTASKKPSNNNNNSSSNNSSSSTDAVYIASKEYLQDNSDKLTNYCLSWIGTPHQIGGTTKQGVDCSGFVYNVYKDVYDIILPRRSADMENAVKLLSNVSKLDEGDLVFFGKTNVNHVGIFLKEDRFIHSSTSKGVIVSSLEEKYWKQNYHSCGYHPNKRKKH